jgi:hypothetical protein
MGAAGGGAKQQQQREGGGAAMARGAPRRMRTLALVVIGVCVALMSYTMWILARPLYWRLYAEVIHRYESDAAQQLIQELAKETGAAHAGLGVVAGGGGGVVRAAAGVCVMGAAGCRGRAALRCRPPRPRSPSSPPPAPAAPQPGSRSAWSWRGEKRCRA